MKKILIADASKASLVMTSEVFKDNYPGIQVLVARTAAETISLAKSTKNIDAFVIDFDLPDANGAQTALQLKRLSTTTPVLLTAFNTEEVATLIESTLSKYEDCRCWLKKPVTPDVVIAVTQRYCEGKMRLLKRIPCHLPAFIQLEIEHIEEIKMISMPMRKQAMAKAKPIRKKTQKKQPVKNMTSRSKTSPTKTSQRSSSSKNKKTIVGKKTTRSTSKTQKVRSKTTVKTTSTKSRPPAPKNIVKFQKKTIPLAFYGVIEDCSLNGVKLKPMQIPHANLTSWSEVLKNMKFITPGMKIKVNVPQPDDIIHGKINPFAGVTSVHDSEKIGEKATLLSGKISWISPDSGEWHMGIEFENQILAKELFEAIAFIQTKQQKMARNQASMKTTRHPLNIANKS